MHQRAEERRALRWLVGSIVYLLVVLPVAIASGPPLNWLMPLSAACLVYVRYDLWQTARRRAADRSTPAA